VEPAVGKVLDGIRRAIERSEHSRYAISKATGISQAQLSRLMADKSGLSIESLELLLTFLGLELVIRPKAKRKGK
jgi:hypothetical protein